MNPFRVNIDFEYELFDSTWTFSGKKYRTMCRELEWVYFFMGDDGTCLSTDVKYEKDYLENVQNYSGKKIEISPLSEKATPWWGDTSNEKEKQWNSKITSFEIGSKLGLNPDDSSIVHSEAELNKKFKEGMVIKSPFEFSGRGFKKTAEGEISYPVIIEPWEERLMDFGLRYDYQKKDLKIIENYNDKKGQFRGGRDIQFMENEFDHELLKMIYEEYRNLGVSDSIQLDCYQTKKGHRYLVEANHRRTMGDFISTVSSKGHSILFLNKKEQKSFEKTFTSFTRLSPENNFFQCYVVEDVSESYLRELLN